MFTVSGRGRRQIALLLLATFLVGIAARVAVPVRLHAVHGEKHGISAFQAATDTAALQTGLPVKAKRRVAWRAHHAPVIMLTRLPALVFQARATTMSFSLAFLETRTPAESLRPPC